VRKFLVDKTVAGLSLQQYKKYSVETRLLDNPRHEHLTKYN
jgi:hypothetical protein